MRDGPTARDDAFEARLQKLEDRDRALREFIVPAYWHLMDRLYDLVGVGAPAPACLACGQARPVQDYATRTDACVFGGGRLDRLECPGCGCIFGPLKYLRLPEALIEADYRLLYSYYQEGDSTEEELRAFELLKPEKGKLYLNWGSGGWSRSVEILRAQGYDVWGYEPNAASDSPFVVRNRGEISARFDGIFSNNVIEHFIAPDLQFRDFRRILAPAGRMVHASPCYAWSFAFTRFHVFFPLGHAAGALAARTGFDLQSMVSEGDFRAALFTRADLEHAPPSP